MFRIITTAVTDETSHENKHSSTDRSPRGGTTWKDTPKNVPTSSASLLEKNVSALKPTETQCMDDHQFHLMFRSGTSEIAPMCALIACNVPLYLARIGGPHLLWTVDMLARSFTKWNKACVKRLARLISSINPTKHHGQCFCWRHRSGLQTWIISVCFFC